MHTKTATLALLAFITISNAAPLSDRQSWSYAQRRALDRRAGAVCSDEASTYGLSSGKTESDCASTASATGFRANSISAPCTIPVQGSSKKGICYLGGNSSRRRSSEDGPEQPEDDAPEGSGVNEPEDGPESGEDSTSPGDDEPTTGDPEDGASSPCPDGQESPDSSSDGPRPKGQEPPTPPLPFPSGQSPVQAPQPSSVSTSSSAATPSHTPCPGNEPQAPPPPPLGNTTIPNSTTTDDDSLKWVGPSLFRLFGGLF